MAKNKNRLNQPQLYCGLTASTPVQSNNTITDQNNCEMARLHSS